MLPKNKFDVDAIEKLALIPLEELKPEIPKLLEWLQDGNWPVAFPMAAFLGNIGDLTIPHLALILQSDDVMWKYWCIELLIKHLPPSLTSNLDMELEALSQNPSSEEIDAGVNIVATEALSISRFD